MSKKYFHPLIAVAFGLGLLVFMMQSITATTAVVAKGESNTPEEVTYTPLTWVQARLAPAEDTPKMALQAAYQQVLNAGVYEFTADSQQTLIPRPSTAMIGQTDQRVNLHLEGEVTLPDTTRLSMHLDGMGFDPTPIALLQEGDHTYLLENGEKVPFDNPMGLVAPTGDYLNYLAAAENVAPCVTDEAPFTTAVSCYTYDIDGQQYARYVRDQLQAQLDQSATAAPPGIEREVGLSPILVNMTGSGKVWLDEHGLPLRQAVEMDMPAVSREFDADTRLVVDYRFEADVVAAVTAPHTSIFSLPLPTADAIVSQVETALPNVLVLALVIGILALLVALHRRRWMYSFFAVSLSAILFLTPLLQTASIIFFNNRVAYAADTTDLPTVLAERMGDQATAAAATAALAAPAGAPETAVAAQDTLSTPTSTYQPTAYCGKGGNSDLDGDGLADDAENCLGTDPNQADTDLDGIDDGDEVTGFTFSDQTWYSDPLNPDSNQDGLTDGNEWTTDYGGFAANWDLDEDGIPNMWDKDDDGDGVSDDNDLSPTAYTDYFSEPDSSTRTISETFNFNITGQYNGYIYIEMQVQPENLDHLRYGIPTLDWGYDNKGLIQDLNSSLDDIRLIPLLSVESNVLPSSELQSDYSVTVMQDTDKDGYREMLMPLSLIGDGGTTEALAMRMAYGPDALAELSQAGIRWQNASLVWMVQAKLDSENSADITEKNQPIHLYTEASMRLAGWQITKSGRFNSAILGTPDMPDNDRQLFQLLFGLSGSYLSQPAITLSEVNARFSGANTPIEQKWGVTATVRVDAPAVKYSHYDEGVHDLDNRVKTFLTNNYDLDDTTTLLIASDSEMGLYGLEDMGALTPSVNQLGVNLNEIYVANTRSLELHMRDGWDVVGPDEFSNAVTKRNAGFFKTAKTDLQDQYPDITEEELIALTLAFYHTWQSGRTRTMSIDGITTRGTTEFADEVLHYRYSLGPFSKEDGANNIETLAGYLVEVGNFAQKGSGLIFGAGGAQSFQFMQSHFSEVMEMGFNPTTSRYINAVVDSFNTLANSVTLLAEGEVHAAFESLLHSDEFTSANQTFLATVTAIDTAYDTVQTVNKALSKGKSVTTKLMKTANKLSKVSKVGVALLILDIGMQVTMFILKGDFSPAAIAALIAGIIMSVIMFIIALNPVGAIIVAIVGVIDLILLLVGLGDYQISGYAKAFIGLGFYSSAALTKLKINSITFVDRQTKLIDPEVGYVAGNRFVISDQFKAVIEMARSDWKDDFGFTRLKQEIAHWGGISNKYLARSWACAEFQLATSPAMSAVTTKCPSPLMGYDPENPPSKESIGFQNPMVAEVLLSTPGANLQIAVTSRVIARTYNLNGGIVHLFKSGNIMSYDPFTLTLPDDMKDMDEEDKRSWEPQTIYLDVLPGTVEAFWTWSNWGDLHHGRILTNPDPDADGMSTKDEINTRLGSKAYALLNDDLGPTAQNLGFKNVNQLLAAWETTINGRTVEALLAANNDCPTGDDWPDLCDSSTIAFWLDSDSDDDGLSDKFEYDNQSALGTDFTKYDTDGDGLSDGFEYDIGTGINARDTDGDGLTDAQEVYHPTENGTWTGGYVIQLPQYGAVGPNGRIMMDIRIFSDPHSADTDGDGLSDYAEKESGTSATAYNRAPRVTLSGQPWAVSPTGQGAVYVGPSDRITLTTSIDVFPPFTVSDTLTLDIPPSVLNPNTTPALSGSRSVPNTGVTSQPKWDFANNILQPQEYLYATTSGWSPWVSNSRTATATLTLPYNDGDSTQQSEVPIVLDADAPSFSLLTPAHGDLIGGGVSHFVMGGSSNDATTWIDHIELDLPYLSAQTITDSLNLSPWAYTWELPTDGIYNISGRAVDFVDNDSAEDSVRVMIDNGAPTVDVNLTDGAVYGPPQDSDVITITLTGTASENYSGLTRVQISTDGGPWREVWTRDSATSENTTYTDFNAPFYQRATGATWDAEWTLPNIESVQGYHSLRVRAFDEAGNWPTLIERTIIIDVLPPTDDLVNRAYLNEYPHVLANEPHTFSGVANDVGNVPQPSRPAELAGTLDSIEDATIWLGTASIAENDAGVNVAWIGDFNGDRRGDLLVGLPAAADGAGKIAVIYGRAGDWPIPDAQEMLADASSSFKGLPGAGIGMQADAAGDVNGDGLADIIVGDAANNAVYLILGRNTYHGQNQLLDDATDVHIRKLQVPDGQQIGHNLAAAGDVNGDGYDDILIGATGSLNATYLLLGQSDPIWETNDIDQHAAAVLYNAGSATLGAIGDLDGDFHDEFGVGMNSNLYLFEGSGTFAPRAGVAIYPQDDAVYTLASADSTPKFAALGDVNGDNKDDMIYSDGANQHLLLGDDTLTDGPQLAQTYQDGTQFLTAPGDVDNDGRNDILLGDGANAYLILGSTPGVTQATINGVTTAASVPFAAGADLNSDGSSDLLLVPTAASANAAAATSDSTFDLPPTWVPRLPEQTLGTYVGATTWTAVPNADAYVNADGVCHSLTPCYTTIQTAVDATGASDLIIVQPGVYDSFTVSGSSHDNLTIRGMNPDTIFVDAGGDAYAARINDADSVRLENMTLRNASYGVQLEDAGIGGHEDTQLAERTILDHLFIYDTSAHNIYLDRSSTVTVSHSTLARAGNHVGVDLSDQFDPTVNVGWQTEPDTPDAFYDGGGLATYDDIIFYCTGGGDRICKWKRAGDTGWFTPWAPPSDLEPGSTLAAGSDGQFYVVAAPGWDDVQEPEEGIATTSDSGMIASTFDGHLLVAPQLGQGIYEWDGSSWTNISSSILEWGNWDGVAENPTNGDLALAAAWKGVYVWDGTEFTNITTDNITGIIYDSQGNLYGAKATLGTDSLVKFDGTQWSTVTEVNDRTAIRLAVDDQNNVYFAHNSSVFHYDGSTNYGLGNIESVTNTVKALAYDQTIDKLFACTELGVARYDGSSWTMLPPVTTGAGTLTSSSCNDVAYSGQIFVSGQWYEETPEGTLRINLASWNDFDNQWQPIGVNELCVYGEPQWCEVGRLAGGMHGLYVEGVGFYDLGDDNYDYLGQKVAHYHFSTSVYSPTLNAWSTLAAPPVIGSGASMAGSADEKLALIAGNGSDRVYTYDIATNQWDSNDTLETGGTQDPITVTASAMTLGDGWLYAIMDGGEFCSSGNGEYWSCYSEGDIDESTMGTIDGGASLAYDPKFDVFYAFTGGNGTNMLRYDTESETWALLPPERFAPSSIKPGAGLVYVSGQNENALYAAEGNYTGSNRGFWRYPIPEPNKIGFEYSAIVVPPGSTSANWLSLDDPMPEDFNFSTGTGSLWFNSTGQPNNGGTIPRSSANPFLDSAHDVYRMAQSGYDVGYHAYTEPVTATTTTGVQTAINSGANRVVVEPGYYEEDVYLANGVEVVGTNPDWTVIRPLSGSTAGALVRAEGATGASLSRFTLDGQDSGLNGFAASGNAAHLTLTRARIFDTDTAVTLDGSDTDLEVAHATIANNSSGLVATSCAAIDVRNSIFAHHSSVGLSHESCAPVQLHTYNLYWANASDFGNAADAGAAELFLDPNFVDAMDHDYRTFNYSPIIDAGNPTDPAPPGAGSRADIGYIEQGRVNYYVDDSYCPTCTNDGLTWQIDAFSTIQDGLDAAHNALLNLNPSHTEVPQLVVGIAPGTYNETVTVPSHVLLMGSGAETTTLDGSGATAVTFNGVTQSGIRDLTITNADTAVFIDGASNTIDLRHNIFTNNNTAVLATGRATASVEYNTFANNTTGLQAINPGSWLIAMHNIVANGATGLRAVDNGQLFSDYNLLYTTTDYEDVTAGDADITGQDPLFTSGVTPYRLSETSPAVDAAALNAAVPNGGGSVADLGYSELLAAPITLLLGQEDLSTVMGNSGVAAVEYGVVHVPDPATAVTATLPNTWNNITLDTPGDTYSYWDTNYTPTTEGMHRFYSRATDVVGNQEEAEIDWYDGTFVVDSTPPVVEMLSPAAGASLSSPLELRAQVSDYAAGDFSIEEKDIYFEVDGQRFAAAWAAEPWDEDANEPRVFRAWVDLALGSYSSITAVAEDKAGNSSTSAPISLNVTGSAPADTTAPELIIAQPASGGWVTSTVQFMGTASDAGSGIASTEVSVDGGATWRPATVSGNDWTLTWQGPDNEPFVSYPAVVRAADRAGNITTTALPFTIDEVPPTGLLPVTFSAAEGTHFDAATTLTINWNEPFDVSGVVTTFLTVDQITNTTPSDVIVGTSFDANINTNGEWYAHLMLTDAAGNAVLHHFGPWYAGINDGAFSQSQQSIIVDGYVDEDNGEWQLDTEFLDNDERTIGSEVTYSPADPQKFLTTWDANHYYMAWRGAQWTLDGELWIYLNSGSGGSDQLILPPASAPDATLPFAANYAVQITSPVTGTLWEHSGGWQPSTQPWNFAQGSLGDTEISLPLFGTSNFETLAFGLGDDHNIWAIFPSSNALNPAVYAAEPAGVSLAQSAGLDMPTAVAAGGWQAYHWDDITTVTDVAANQPIASSLELNMESNPTPMVMPGPDSTIEYVVRLTNKEAYTMTGKQIAFIAIPSSIVSHDDIEGATCATTNPWQCTLDPLPPGASTITLTMRMASDLASTEQVSMYAMLQDSAIPPELNTQSNLSHNLDSAPPVVELLSPPFATLGAQNFTGTADDGLGIGVDYVEIRPNGGSWQRLAGTTFWTGDLTISPFAEHGDTWQFDVRAVDFYGQQSDPLPISFTVDLEAPTVTLNTPSGFTDNLNEITGTVLDSPDSSQTQQVLVQVDDEPWREATIFAPSEAGEQSFLWSWNAPTSDGSSHTVRVQATDYMGNVGTLDQPQTITLDNVAPVITVTGTLTEVIVQDYRPNVGVGGPVLNGRAADGGGIAQVELFVEMPDGTSYRETVTLTNGNWEYTPVLEKVGDYRLRAEIKDTVGNTAVSDFYEFTVIAAPDSYTNQFRTDEDTPITFEPLFNDLDLDGDELSIEAVGPAENGTAVISPTTWLVYTPTLNFNGTEVLTYTASDGVLTDTTSITITVTPVNDAPVIDGDNPVRRDIEEDSTLALSFDSEDVDGDTLTWTLETEDGTAVITNTAGSGNSHIDMTFTPTADFNGVATVDIHNSDGLLTDTVQAEITVSKVDDAPRPATDYLVLVPTDNSQPVQLDVLENDTEVDGQTLSLTAVGTPSQSSTATILNNTVVYTPNLTIGATESITYTASDGSLTATGTISATMVPGDASGAENTIITIPDAGISQTMAVTLTIPTITNTAKVNVVFSHSEPPTQTLNNHAFAGLAFTIDAYLNGVLTSPYLLPTPITMTLTYDEALIDHIMGDETDLGLWRWAETAWTQDSITLVSQDTDTNQLVFSISHLSQFALYGWDGYQIYLPIVIKSP